MKGLCHRSKLHPQVIRLEEFGKFLCTFYTIGLILVMHLWCYDPDEVEVAVATLEARSRGKDRPEGLPFNKTLLKEQETIYNKRIYHHAIVGARGIVLLWIFNTLLKASVLVSYSVSRS